MWSRLDYTIFETTTPSSAEGRLPEIIESKLLEGTGEKTSVDDGCDKLLAQPPSILNNHHNINNVIKSENSKNQELSDDQTVGGANNQKLDDFEQLLDSASASSNIINKKLVCRNNSDISDDSYLLKSATASSFTLSENISKNVSVGLINTLSGEASSSGVSSINGSLSLSQNTTLLPELNNPATPTLGNDEEDENLKSEPTTCTSHVDDFYMNFMDEIKNEWLHFRPKTPPLSCSPTDDILFDSDLTDKTKKFAVELQMLDDAYKETDESGYTDNIYRTQPMSFNFCNKFIGLNNEAMQENSTCIKTEPVEFMDESNEGTSKAVEQDAVRRLLQKYQNDVANDETLELEIDEIDFDECLTNNETIGCSAFKLLNDDLMETFKSDVKENKFENSADVTVKSEIIDIPQTNSVQNIDAKEAPIAELQTHNYVLQYGSPVTSNTVTLSSISSNSNMLSCSPSIDSGMTPATTLFQQQFINSGNAIMSHQTQQNKLQPIVYDSNTIVLAAAPNRNNKLNGPSDRNCKFKK